MNAQRRPARRLTSMALALAVATLLSTAAPVVAFDFDLNRAPNQMLRTDVFPDRTVLESLRNRRNFQIEQQRFREDDRKAGVTVAPKRQKVVQFRRNCRTEPFGNNFLVSCR